MKRPLTIFVPHCSDLLTDHMPHGDGLIAHGFMTHLARRGHRLHVAAQRVELREPLHPNITLYEIPLICSGKLSQRVEYMLRVRQLLYKLKNNHRFDLIHQLNPVFGAVSLSLVGLGLPVILGTYVARWPHDPDPVSSKDWLGRTAARCRDKIARLQQGQADALLLTTPAAFNRIPKPAELRDRVHFLPHGIDTGLFSPTPEAIPNEEPATKKAVPTILFFARIRRMKGIFTLIDAFPPVLREFPAARLRIAGDGPDLAEVKRRVAELGCTEQVDFLGRQERYGAPALYRECSLYCFPSFGEPYGTTLVEAMSCGKPVVVTDSGGPPHIVPKSGGTFFPAGDVSALSRALCELLRNPQRRAAMGRENRRVVEATMSWDRVAERLENIYEITLSRIQNRALCGSRPSRISETASQVTNVGD
jgi:L-malate glycosyltransferase